MPHVLASVQVGDFDQFLSVFSTKGADLRGKQGSRGARLFRSADAPNEVTILFDWDHDAFRQFMTSAEGQGVMQEAGLQGKPDTVFLEHVTDSDS